MQVEIARTRRLSHLSVTQGLFTLNSVLVRRVVNVTSPCSVQHYQVVWVSSSSSLALRGQLLPHHGLCKLVGPSTHV